jgi:hypothetical protein
MADGMRPITGTWMKKLHLAWESKKTEFQDDADECMRFFDGPYDWLYSGWKRPGTSGFSWDMGEDALPGPSTRITINKVAELVQLFGPALYHRNPIRKVTPRKVVPPVPEMFGLPPDPSMVDMNTIDPNAVMAFQQAINASESSLKIDKMRAELLEKYLNYTPTAMDLKTHSRWAIDEALIKGFGVLLTQSYRPPGSTQSFSSTSYESVDNLYLDPDAERWSDIKWMAIKCVHPVWQVERDYGHAPGSLQGVAGMESFSQISEVETDPTGDYRRKQGMTSDLIVYYKIWSKMGMGGRLSGIDQNQASKFDAFGDYVYLVLADGYPYPLNLPKPIADAMLGEDQDLAMQAQQIAMQSLSWPTPFWADNTWPVTPIVFHWRPKKLWPMSHMKPGLGELKFLNWAWAFLAGKVKTASRDFVAIAKSAGEELKERIKHGPDYSIIEVESIHQSIDNVVKFMQHPGFNPELYKVIEGVTFNFERRVGLTELMYGLSSRQMRSAQEASIKSDAVSVRPDDMANLVEDAMTDVARKEALTARWHLKGPDVSRVLGDSGAQMWEQLVVSSDPGAILYQLEYRIEAGSARKPNRSTEAENMRDAVQNLFQPLFSYAQATGNVKPINSLIEDWAKSIDLDPNKYLLEPPPPPPMPPAGPAGPPTEGGEQPPQQQSPTPPPPPGVPA